MEFTNPFSKNKKSRDEMILDLDIQLRRLEDQYKIIINRELRALRYSRKNNSENPRSVGKIKHAYYGLGVIKQAQENLRDVRTTNELFSTMNEMGTALKLLNRISSSTERPHSFTIDRQIKKMDKNIGVQAVSESRIAKTIGGIDTQVSDYSISIVGPGKYATDIWNQAI